MKNRYEALLVLDTQGRDDTVKDIVDRLEAEFQKEGAEIEQVQKMDRRQFSYVAGNLDAGYYVNFVFHADPQLITQTALEVQTRSGSLSPALPASSPEERAAREKSWPRPSNSATTAAWPVSTKLFCSEISRATPRSATPPKEQRGHGIRHGRQSRLHRSKTVRNAKKSPSST